MSRNDMLRGRLLMFTAICIGLLILFAWFLTRLLPADEARPRAESIASHKVRNDTGMQGLPGSQIRKAASSDRVSDKVQSLLNIRSDEIGLITIPKWALDDYFDDSIHSAESEQQLPILQAIASKESLASGLEGILKKGGPLAVRVAGRDPTELSGNGVHMKISSVRESGFASTVRLEMTGNGVTVPYEFTLYPNHALVFRLPPPAEVGVAILIGADPESPGTAVK